MLYLIRIRSVHNLPEAKKLLTGMQLSPSMPLARESLIKNSSAWSSVQAVFLNNL